MTTGTADDTAPPAEPRWTDVLRGFFPLALMASLVAVLVSRHADFLRASISGAAVLAGLSWAWKLPGDRLPKQFALAIAHLLARRSTSTALWTAFVVAAIGSFFVSSLHVTASKPPEDAVWLYRLEESADAPGLATKVDSVKLDGRHPHRDFYVFPSFKRRVWLLTSDNERTDPEIFYPWKALTVDYKQEFKSAGIAAFLPWQTFLAVMGKARPLMVRITDDSTGALVATDSLVDPTRMPSIVLSYAGVAPTIDSSTAARWLQLALRDAGGDTSAAANVVKDWSAPHLLRAGSALRNGQRLRIVLLKANGDTAGTETLTLSRTFSDALVRRRS